MLKNIIIILGSLILLAGCGGGGGSSSYEPSNVKVTSITPNDSGDAGFSYSFVYTISSSKAESSVTTSFFLINADELDGATTDSTETNVTSYYLGADTIEGVASGSTSRSVSFEIPSNADTAGNYIISAVVDPNDLISETNESDNTTSSDGRSSTGKAISGKSLSLSLANVTKTNIFVKKVEIDNTTVIFDEHDIAGTFAALTADADHPHYGNAHITGHVTFGVEGRVPTQAELNAVKIKMQMKTPVSDTWTDLNYWNSEAEAYQSYITFNTLEREEAALDAGEFEHRLPSEYTMDIDINIPTALITTLMAEVATLTATPNYNKIAVRILVDSEAALDNYEDEDNDYQFTISLYSSRDATAKAADNYLIEKSYSKSAGSKSKVSIGIDTYSKIGIDEEGDKFGAISLNTFTAPIHMFNHSANLLDMSSYYAAYANVANADDTGYKNTIDFLGINIYDYEYYVLPYTVSYTRSWNKERKFVEANMFIGPVPVTMEAGVSGSTGFTVSATLDVDGITSDNDLPSMNFDAYASAGVGNSIFSAGPEVDLLILEELLNVQAGAVLAYVANTPVSATASIKAVNELEAIKGKFGVYVKYPTTKWCKKWGVHYPCGVKTAKSTHWFYETNALYKKSSTIINESNTWNSF